MKVGMWIITEKGFISAVEYRPSKDRGNASADKQLPECLRVFPEHGSRSERRKFARNTKHGFILARGRASEHLEQLRPYFPELQIQEDRGADYKFRCVLPRMAFSNWAADVAMNIDYDSHFKEVVRSRAPLGEQLYPLLMSVWSTLNRLGSKSESWGPVGKLKGGVRITNHGGGFGGGSGGYGRQGQNELNFDDLYPWQQNGQDLDGDSSPSTPPHGGHRIPDLPKLLDLLGKMPVEQIDLPNGTSDMVFFVWTEAADKFAGVAGGLETDDLIELLEDCMGNAKDDEKPHIERELERLHDVAVDEDAASAEQTPARASVCELAGRHVSATRHSIQECSVEKKRLEKIVAADPGGAG